MRRLLVLALLLLPSLASASPGVSAELVLGVQDVPDTAIIAAQPRLVLRVDRDADLTGYARLGVGAAVLTMERGGDGTLLEAAGGGELRRGIFQLRAGLGAQRAVYRKTYESYDSRVDFESYTAFAELQPQLVFPRFVIGIDLRAHRELDTNSSYRGGEWTDRRSSGTQYAAGLSLGVRF